MDDRELLELPIARETVFSGALIHVDHMRVTLPDGREALREIVVHGGAAAIVPVDEEGNVTLVRQHRVAVDEVMLEIPAGKLDHPGEDPLCCAQRELEEETGLRAESWTLLCPAITTPGFCTERIGLYLATGLKPCKPHLDADEFLNVVKMPLSEAIARVISGELHDAKSALGLLLAEKHLQQAND